MSIDVDSLVAIDVHAHAERLGGEPQDPVTGSRIADAIAGPVTRSRRKRSSRCLFRSAPTPGA
jgi:hypothetical protein